MWEVWGAEEAMSEHVLLTWAQSCQGPQRLRPMGIAMPFFGSDSGKFGLMIEQYMEKLASRVSSSEWL